MGEIIKEDKRYCPECGKEIIGRAGKKFCSDSCRNNFNNRESKDITNLFRNTHNKLRKNYRILFELLDSKDKVKVDRKTLVKKKFDFDAITAVETAKTGSTYYFIYNFCYQTLENDVYLIFKSEN